MVFIMILTLFAACSKKDEEVINLPEGEVYESAEGLVDENGELVEQEGNGIVFDQEEDDAKLAFIERDPSAFYGSWTATSDKAIYLYGNGFWRYYRYAFNGILSKDAFSASIWYGS